MCQTREGTGTPGLGLGRQQPVMRGRRSWKGPRYGDGLLLPLRVTVLVSEPQAGPRAGSQRCKTVVCSDPQMAHGSHPSRLCACDKANQKVLTGNLLGQLCPWAASRASVSPIWLQKVTLLWPNQTFQKALWARPFLPPPGPWGLICILGIKMLTPLRAQPHIKMLLGG